MKSILTAAILSTLATSALACDPAAPYGFKSLTLGAPAARSDIDAIMHVDLVAPCSDDSLATCFVGTGTLAENPARLIVKVRDGIAAHVLVRFESAQFETIAWAIGAKYCAPSDLLHGLARGFVVWHGARGEQIALDKYIPGQAESALVMRSKDQVSRDTAASDKRSKDI
jgi:hypothetical protein